MVFRLLFGGPIKSSLIQATVDITHNAKLRNPIGGGGFTDSVVCTETPSGARARAM